MGTINGGTARNVIADKVEIEGTIRTLNPSIREYVNMRVEEFESFWNESLNQYT